MGLVLPYVVGDVLREVRDASGLTQIQLAADSGVDRSHISRIELGQVNPTIDMLYKLLRHLNTTPGDFIATIDDRLKRSSEYSWIEDHKTKGSE